MASNTSIQLRKSGTAGNSPADLNYGELALNYADGRLFYKNAGGTISTFSSGSGGGNSDMSSGNTELITTTADQVVDTFDKTLYRSAKYLIQAINGADVHFTEVVIIHNDNDIFGNEYGVFYSGASLITVSATIDSSNVSLVITPTNADTFIDYNRTTIVARPFGGSTSSGDLMSLSGSEDLSLGSGTEDLMV
jgi:hypothetical protein